MTKKILKRIYTFFIEKVSYKKGTGKMDITPDEVQGTLKYNILRNTLHLQMLYRQLLDQQAAPPTILNSGTKSTTTKVFVQLAPFLDQTNIIVLVGVGQSLKERQVLGVFQACEGKCIHI